MIGTSEIPTLSSLLETAQSAALNAGVLLRQEFHRAGGPRAADDHHALVDAEAEALLRHTLLGAAPGSAFVGEELGAFGPAEPAGGLRWIVDPHDGTSAFLRRMRGSSVSIGLVRDGVPVLGVVYAFCAPDDGGDLFSWCEGMVVIRRNGEALFREWPEKPSAQTVVLTSPGAERAPERASVLLSPCRFRGVPSVAWRLALLAAGEGDFALSLHGTNTWDYAAGDALVRGAGGGVFGEHLKPVGYGAAGLATCGNRLFAGHPEFVRRFAPRDFTPAFRPLADRKARFHTIRSAPKAAIEDAGVLRRAQGCLLGQLAGDSLGSLVEFQTATQIQQRFPGGVKELADGGSWNTLAGQPTDDSEMALALARCIVEAGRYDPAHALEVYRWWNSTGPFDVGNTTRSALEGEPNPDSQANGSLMRIAPIGIFAASVSPESASRLAALDAELTHPNPVCIASTAVFAASVAYAISSGEAPMFVHAAALSTAAGLGVPAEVFEALQRAEYAPPEDFQSSMGWVLIAFQNAYYQLLHAPTLETALVETVRMGGDTDTNAAICGALLGAVHGRESLPLQWRRAILSCHAIEGRPEVRRARPEGLWPVDALALAEALLAAGRRQ